MAVLLVFPVLLVVLPVMPMVMVADMWTTLGCHCHLRHLQTRI